MNTATRQLTREDMDVNGGVVRPSEVPLWVGLANFAIDGHRIRMSVTNDKGWYWLRFKTQDGKLAPEQHADLEARGWKFSVKKRLGYWHDNPTQETVKFIRALGYTSAALPAPAPEKAAPVVNGPLVNAVTTARKPAAKVAVPTSSGLRYNAAGRLIDENGKFVNAKNAAPPAPAKASVMPEVVEDESPVWTQVDTTPGNEEFVEATPEDAADTDAHMLGYEDGLADADDPDVPDTYTRNEMAKREGMTVLQLAATLGNAYIQGYLEGFEAQRPKPVVARGLAARVAAYRAHR